MRALLRWLLACAVLVVTNAFTLLPLAPRDAMTAAPGLKNHARAVLPLRMAADDEKAAKVAAAKAKAVKAKAAEKEAPEEKEETADEKAAREAAEQAAAEAAAKAEAEPEAAKKKEEEIAARAAKRAEEEAARAAKIKADKTEKAKTAVNKAGKEFGIGKELFIARWTEEAIVVGDGDWAAMTEEVPDLCDNIGVDKALFERGDAKCVAMIKALDQLQVAITGELATPASDLVPAFITLKNRPGLVGKSYAREKALAKEAEEKKREFVAQGRIPRGEGGRLW